MPEIFQTWLIINFKSQHIGLICLCKDETGYSFDPGEVTITEVSRDYGEGTNTIVWTDPNNYDPIQNLISKEYVVYYATEDNLNYFNTAGTTTDLSYEAYIYSGDADKVFYYKVVTKYTKLFCRFISWESSLFLEE